MSDMDFHHVSVLLWESIEGLNIKPDGIYIDGTAGGAGHSREIAKRLTTGRLIALDKDPDAVKIASERLAEYPCAKVIHSDFAEIPAVLDELGIEKVDGVLLDLGVSSHQLDDAERGFSYHSEAPLDMRMSQEGLSAYDLVNKASGAERGKIHAAHSKRHCGRTKNKANRNHHGACGYSAKRGSGGGSPGRRSSGAKNLSGNTHCGKRRTGQAFRSVGRRL